MSEIQRKSVYSVTFQYYCNAGAFHEVKAVVAAEDEENAEDLAMRSLKKRGLINDVRTMLQAFVNIEFDDVILEV